MSRAYRRRAGAHDAQVQTLFLRLKAALARDLAPYVVTRRGRSAFVLIGRDGWRRITTDEARELLATLDKTTIETR